MNLRAADQLLTREQLIVGEHVLVPVGGRDLEFGGDRQRDRTGGNHPDSRIGGFLRQDAAIVGKILTQILERVDDAAVRLDHAALQLVDVAVRQMGQQFGCPSSQSAGLQIDEGGIPPRHPGSASRLPPVRPFTRYPAGITRGTG